MSDGEQSAPDPVVPQPTPQVPPLRESFDLDDLLDDEGCVIVPEDEE